MASTLPSPNPCCTGCGALTVTVIEPTPGVLDGWFVVDTIPLLRVLPNRSTNVYCQVNGGEVFDDGYGGVYVWRNAATNADDGVNWIKPNDTIDANPGRWKKEI